ncbi:MAG: hypothetical protein WC832_06215 [Anaerolineales bacterium]
MTTYMLDPGPANRDGAFPISQADYEQLMSKANFRTIHDQTDLSQTMSLSLQPLVRYWLIPFPDTNGWIVQEAV